MDWRILCLVVYLAGGIMATCWYRSQIPEKPLSLNKRTELLKLFMSALLGFSVGPVIMIMDGSTPLLRKIKRQHFSLQALVEGTLWLLWFFTIWSTMDIFTRPSEVWTKNNLVSDVLTLLFLYAMIFWQKRKEHLKAKTEKT